MIQIALTASRQPVMMQAPGSSLDHIGMSNNRAVMTKFRVPGCVVGKKYTIVLSESD